MPLVLIVLALFTLALWLPNLVDLAALVRMLGRRDRGARASSANARAPRLLFLAPAHNEEQLIAHCVRSLVQWIILSAGEHAVSPELRRMAKDRAAPSLRKRPKHFLVAAIHEGAASAQKHRS